MDTTRNISKLLETFVTCAGVGVDISKTKLIRPQVNPTFMGLPRRPVDPNHDSYTYGEKKFFLMKTYMVLNEMLDKDKSVYL